MKENSEIFRKCVGKSQLEELAALSQWMKQEKIISEKKVHVLVKYFSSVHRGTRGGSGTLPNEKSVCTDFHKILIGTDKTGHKKSNDK